MWWSGLPCREAKEIQESLGRTCQVWQLLLNWSLCFDVAASPVSDGCGPPLELQRRRSSRQAETVWGEITSELSAAECEYLKAVMSSWNRFQVSGPIRLPLHKGLGNMFTCRYRVAHVQPRTKRSSQWLSGEGQASGQWGYDEDPRESYTGLGLWHLWVKLSELWCPHLLPYSSMIFLILWRLSLWSPWRYTDVSGSNQDLWSVIVLWNHYLRMNSSILWARILEWVAVHFSRGSSQSRDQT